MGWAHVPLKITKLRFPSFGAAFVALTLAAGACYEGSGDSWRASSSGATCQAGDEAPCSCATGADGVQVCDKNGDWSVCLRDNTVCSTASSGGGGSTSSSTSSSTTTGPGTGDSCSNTGKCTLTIGSPTCDACAHSSEGCCYQIGTCIDADPRCCSDAACAAENCAGTSNLSACLQEKCGLPQNQFSELVTLMDTCIPNKCASECQ